MTHFFTRIALMAILLSVVPRVDAQEVSISLSPQIDTLNAQLLRNPEDQSLQLSLIDAYTLSFNPELALLELLDAEAQGKLTREAVGVKGAVQLSLEQTSAAFSSLTEAYLSSPSDETLLLIAILEYARGEPQRGLWEISRLKSRISDLSIKLLGLYERFYLNGRRTIARAILRALEETDRVAYESYFPVPKISILSPADNFATEASQVSVVVEVHHSRPVQRIRVGESMVYDRGEWKGGSSKEEFDQTYTVLLDVREGRREIIALVSDIFGNESADTIHVNGMNFNRLSVWRSPLVDTLRTNLKYLQNYVPDTVLSMNQRAVARALLIGGTSSPDSTEVFHRTLFMHEALTNPVSGLVPASNTKILVGGRVEEQTMKMVLDEWLLKGATFQSVTIVYLAGNWTIDQRGWYLHDLSGQSVDIRPFAEGMRSLASAGVMFVFDGTMDNRSLLESEIQRLVAGATIPFEAVILPPGERWPRMWLSATLSPPLSDAALQGTGLFLAKDLQDNIPGTSYFNNDRAPIPVAKNPGAVIAGTTSRLLAALSQKLAKDKIPETTRRKILSFSQDWRRYNEVARYLTNQFSVSDFVIRVDEYQRRAGGGEK